MLGCRGPAAREEPEPALEGAIAPTSAEPAKNVAVPKDAAGETASASSAVHGSLSTQVRSRSSGKAHDLDAYTLLAADLGDAERDRWTARLVGRMSADLDGQSGASQQVFPSIQDSHDGAAQFDLYEAFVEGARPFGLPLDARVGRQYEYETPEFAQFDGVRVESNPIGAKKLELGALAGVPVRLNEATSIDDQIGAAWAEAKLWKTGRVRADWMHVHQSEPANDFRSDLYGLALWQTLGKHLSLDGRYTRLESDDRDLRLRSTWDSGDGALTVQASWYRLLQTQRAYADEFDPYFSTLQEFEPYDQWRLLVSKSLGPRVNVDLGGDLRTLANADDESRLNHDYQRGYATLVIADVGTPGLDLSCTADAWNSDAQDIQTWGVDATWKANEQWRLSAGSSYSLFEYDVVNDVERDDVRVWYGRVRRKLGTAWTLELQYEYEDADGDDYQQITARAAWRF